MVGDPDAAHWEAIARARRSLADQLDGLTPEQWASQSLCDAWTVRDIAAHLVMPHHTSTATFLVAMVRARGSFAAANGLLTARDAVRPTADLVADLRRYAASRFTPPGFGWQAPLTDVLVHGQDIRVPLGLPDGDPLSSWTCVLDFLVSKPARRGFASGGERRVRLGATDVVWTHGDGPEVEGPAGALALAITGRNARRHELAGDGVGLLFAAPAR